MCSKAFYLRGKAYQCLKDYEMANGDLQKTLELLDEEETQSAERAHVTEMIEQLKAV